MLPVYIALNSSNFSLYDDIYTWIIGFGFSSGLLPSVLYSLLWLFFAAFYLRVVVVGMDVVFKSHFKDHARSLRGQKRRSSAFDDISKASISSLSTTASALIVNIVVVLFINSLYVFMIISNTVSVAKVILQLVFSFLKLSWNSLGVPACFHAMKDFSHGTRVLAYISTLFFNNVIAVLISAALTDESCFPKLISGDKEAKEIVTYTISQCVDFTVVLNLCDAYIDIEYTQPFSAPIVYGFQCSTAIIRAFLPILFYCYLGMSIVLPAYVLLLASLEKSEINRNILRFVPAILWPRDEVGPNEKHFRPNNVMNFMISHLMVMLTFGVTSPLLALCIAITVTISTGMWISVLGRYVDIQSQLNDVERSDFGRFDSLFKYSWTSLLHSRWSAMFGCGLFFGVMIFDVAGDQNGAGMGILFMFVIIGFLSLLYILEELDIRKLKPNFLNSFPPSIFLLKTLVFLNGDLSKIAVSPDHNDDETGIDLPITKSVLRFSEVPNPIISMSNADFPEEYDAQKSDVVT
jgi:hypothetical protein